MPFDGRKFGPTERLVTVGAQAHIHVDLAKFQGTYGGKFKKEGPAKDAKSYGGYASYNRSPGHFVVKIPDGLDPAFAAPMLCGGVTVYNPLVSNGAGPGVDVGVIGIGGLGHFALLFAKALGANVTAISHSERKKEDAMKLGASKFIATHSGGEQDFAPHARSLDLIIATTNDPEVRHSFDKTDA